MDEFELGKIVVGLKRKYAGEWAGQFERVEVIYDSMDPRAEVQQMLLVTIVNKSPAATIEAARRLELSPNVLFAEPDYVYELYVNPNDPRFREQWALQRVNAPEAWNISRGNGNVIVGVLDSGADGNHPDLMANLLIPRGFGDFRDLTGHGSHVAGTIGAIGNNRIGVAGVNWRVGLAIFKIGNNSIDAASAISAINFATRNNIPVLNNSWGGRQFSSALRAAVSQYQGLFVAAAGNNGASNDLRPIYPASFDLQNVISVAATNQNNALAPFSNFGARSVHIAAPGAGILSTAPGGRYTNQSGTSMAAPHVAGAAALLLSRRPNLGTRELRSIILSSARRLPALNGRVSTGLLDLSAALRRVL
jgi:subtilisin family serine protease